MMTYFCDNCEASIPLDDINKGLARVVDGKIFCKTCLPQMEKAEKEKSVSKIQSLVMWLTGAKTKTHYMALRIICMLVGLAGVALLLKDGFWMVQHLARFEEFLALWRFSEGMFSMLVGIAVMLGGRALADAGDRVIEIENELKKVKTSVVRLKKSVEEL